MSARLSYVRADLAPFSRTLVRELDEAAAVLQRQLSPSSFDRWCDAVLQIARSSFRSWETAAEFLRTSPVMAALLDEERLIEWAQSARELTTASSIVAAAFIHVSPRVAERLSPADLLRWAELGRRLHGDSWKSISLATRYFEESPALLDLLDLETGEAFVAFLAALAHHSYDAAADCLEHGSRILTRVPSEQRRPLLDLARRLALGNWKAAQTLFKESPALFKGVEGELRSWVIRLTSQLAEREPDAALDFLKEMIAALRAAAEEDRQALAPLAETLFALSWRAATALARSAPTVRARAGSRGLHAWYQHGADLLRESVEAGEAFFQLQSSRAKQVLDLVSPGVAFESCAPCSRCTARRSRGAGFGSSPLPT